MKIFRYIKYIFILITSAFLRISCHLLNMVSFNDFYLIWRFKLWFLSMFFFRLHFNPSKSMTDSCPLLSFIFIDKSPPLKFGVDGLCFILFQFLNSASTNSEPEANFKLICTNQRNSVAVSSIIRSETKGWISFITKIPIGFQL